MSRARMSHMDEREDREHYEMDDDHVKIFQFDLFVSPLAFFSVVLVSIHISQTPRRGGKKLIVQFIKRNLGLSYALLDSSANIYFVSLSVFFCNSRNEKKEGKYICISLSLCMLLVNSSRCCCLLPSSFRAPTGAHNTHSRAWLDVIGDARRRGQLKIDKYHLTINNVMPINCKLYWRKTLRRELFFRNGRSEQHKSWRDEIKQRRK